MSTTTMSPARPMTAATSSELRPPARGLGLLLLVVAVLSFVPLVILGPAIGWPASLGNPAAQQLAAIAARPEAVAFGYGVYLLYSVLIAPAMIFLAARVFGGLNRPLAATVVAFAALSALARAIGILRWLTVMPVLATAHGRGDATARAQIETLFGAINTYGGGIGEVLGVSLLMAAAVGTLSAGALVQGGLPRSLAALGLVVAAMLAALGARAFGLPEVMPVAAAVTALSVWMIAVGIWAFRGRKPIDV